MARYMAHEDQLCGSPNLFLGIIVHRKDGRFSWESDQGAFISFVILSILSQTTRQLACMTTFDLL